MKYWIDGDKIRYAGLNVSGYFVIGSGSQQETDYETWIAEGNEPETWIPLIVERGDE